MAAKQILEGFDRCYFICYLDLDLKFEEFMSDQKLFKCFLQQYFVAVFFRNLMHLKFTILTKPIEIRSKLFLMHKSQILERYTLE